MNNFYEQIVTLLGQFFQPYTQYVALTPGQSVAMVLDGRTRVSVGIQVSSAPVTIAITGRLQSGGQWFPLASDGASTFDLSTSGNYLYSWEGTAHEVRCSFSAGTGSIEVTLRSQ